MSKRDDGRRNGFSLTMKQVEPPTSDDEDREETKAVPEGSEQIFWAGKADAGTQINYQSAFA